MTYVITEPGRGIEVGIPRGKLELRYIRDNEGLDVSVLTTINIEDIGSFVEPFRSLLAAVGFSEDTIRQEVGGP